MPDPVFQITFKGRVPTRNFEGSIYGDSPHHLKFTFNFVRSGGQLSRVFDPRPLSYMYLEHCQPLGMTMHANAPWGGGMGAAGID